MSTAVKYNPFDWGVVPSTDDLPNSAAAAIQSDDCAVGDRAHVAGVWYSCTDATLGAATWSPGLSGAAATDISYTPTTSANWIGGAPSDVGEALDYLAAGAQRQKVAGFNVVAAASQTDSPLDLGGVGGGYVAIRAGSITGLSIYLTGAPTVANIAVSVSKNGAAVASTTLTVAPAGDTTQQVTVAIGTSTFVAGDVIGVVYTSGAIGNTPTIYASAEISD
jgi:hypothetical protein